MTTDTIPQQAPKIFTPQPGHQWLQRLLGEWTSECEAGEPGKPAETLRGTESVRSLGGFWVQAEGQGTMPGGDHATMVMTLGYDPLRERYVGTWVGSMMSHLWVYNGWLDPTGQVLTLEADGPNMQNPEQLATYRDIITFLSDDHRTLTSQVRGEDGTWQQFMVAHYRRQR